MITALILGLAQAVAAPSATPAAAVPATAKKERLICEAEQKPGSRIAKRRICRTEAEYALYKARMRDQINAKQKMSFFDEGPSATCMKYVECDK